MRFTDLASSALTRPPQLLLSWKKLPAYPKFPGSTGQVSTDAREPGSPSESQMGALESPCPYSVPRKPPEGASVLSTSGHGDSTYVHAKCAVCPDAPEPDTLKILAEVGSTALSLTWLTLI